MTRFRSDELCGTYLLHIAQGLLKYVLRSFVSYLYQKFKIIFFILYYLPTSYLLIVSTHMRPKWT